MDACKMGDAKRLEQTQADTYQLASIRTGAHCHPTTKGAIGLRIQVNCFISMSGACIFHHPYTVNPKYLHLWSWGPIT